MLTGMAIGGGIIGFLLSLWGYAATLSRDPSCRYPWIVVLIA